jgi:hypothetical protein
MVEAAPVVLLVASLDAVLVFLQNGMLNLGTLKVGRLKVAFMVAQMLVDCSACGEGREGGSSGSCQ